MLYKYKYLRERERERKKERKRKRAISSLLSSSSAFYLPPLLSLFLSLSLTLFLLPLTNTENYIVMQFGRVSDHEFTMDFRYPMSAVQVGEGEK